MGDEKTVESDLDDLEIVIESGDAESDTATAQKADRIDNTGSASGDDFPEIVDVIDLEAVADSPAGTQEEGVVVSEADRLRGEIENLRESYLRKLAEFDNFRKRTDREKADLKRVAGEEVIRDLVPVLDNFERALQHAIDADPDAFRLGVEMISKQLWEILERKGLERIDPAGEQFSPEFHEAIQRVEDSNHPPGTVAWVLAKGYIFGGKLLRPAMVGVSVAPAEPVNNGARADVDSGDEGDSQ